jgi:hypothetical protein
MARTSLTDDSGRWFDTETAVKFMESTRWNGKNHISRATGSQWNHETIYYTKGGRWILYQSSEWEGSLPSYEELAESDAVKWLINNEHTDPDDVKALPKTIADRVTGAVDASEL